MENIQTSYINYSTLALSSRYVYISPAVFLNLTNKISLRSSRRQTSIVQPMPCLEHSNNALFLSKVIFKVFKLFWISFMTLLIDLFEVQFRLNGPLATDNCDGLIILLPRGDLYDSPRAESYYCYTIFCSANTLVFYYLLYGFYGWPL